MSLLTGPEIVKQVEAGNIVIDPFDPKRVGSNSYDLALSPVLRTYVDSELDMRKENGLTEWEIPGNGLVLQPNRLYLGMTIEKAGSFTFAPMLSGRSSAARLGIFPHIVAGFGDVGFCDRWTLEIVVVQPVRIYAGVRLVQLYFETVRGELKLYDGKYKQQDGPTGSRFWKELAPKSYETVTLEMLSREGRINGDHFRFDAGWERETKIGDGTFVPEPASGEGPLNEVRLGGLRIRSSWRRPTR
jgi:dCTP deaminase